MKIKQLELTDFRNYKSEVLRFNDGLTILTGENAQGKTNILEAIFLLSVAKSHRTHHDTEMIYWQAKQAQIKAIIETKQYEIPLELSFNHKGKIAKVNLIEQSKLSHFIGKFNTILFAPEDMQLIKGAPGLRRRFIDIEIGQSHPVYLNYLLEYNKILKQRNIYLKQFGNQKQFDLVYFEILTDQLIERAVQVVKYRIDFTQRLEDIAIPIHLDLSNQRDQLAIKYISHSNKIDYSKLDSLASQFKQEFKRILDREKAYGITQLGPQRDDLLFFINDKPAQFYGSQGQQRTIILSLKLAEIELINQIIGEYPVLLLDDVLSELDDERQHILMTYIVDKVQTILTTSTIQGLKLHELKDADIFYVSQGSVSKGEQLDGRSE